MPEHAPRELPGSGARRGALNKRKGIGRAGLERGQEQRRGPGSVGIAWEVRARPITDRAIRTAVRAALAHGDRAGIAVEVALVSDRTLASIHGRFLGDPAPTDVISFDLGEEDGGPAGEIYVSVDRARAVARERGDSIERELALYLVHGALHLCGFDDRSPRQRARMRAAEALVLAGLGLPSSAPRRARGGTRGPIVNRKTKKTSLG
ncbi:MAG: rRNA maturation RNase YbeY [Planctomycetota bacterium]